MRGWIVRVPATGPCGVQVLWRRTRKEARMEQLRWPGAILIRVTG